MGNAPARNRATACRAIGAVRRKRRVRTKLSICIRKKRFPSAAAAQDRAVQAGLELRPYRCDRCRHFHLTSRTKGKWAPRILL